MVKRKVKRSKSRKVVKVSNPIDYHNRRIKLGLKNLVVFALLSLIALSLEKFSTDLVYVNFFALLKIVFSSVSLAFLIVVIIFLFLKGFRKK